MQDAVRKSVEYSVIRIALELDLVLQRKQLVAVCILGLHDDDADHKVQTLLLEFGHELISFKQRYGRVMDDAVKFVVGPFWDFDLKTAL